MQWTSEQWHATKVAESPERAARDAAAVAAPWALVKVATELAVLRRAVVALLHLNAAPARRTLARDAVASIKAFGAHRLPTTIARESRDGSAAVARTNTR